MRLSPGFHRTTCNECGESGDIRIKPNTLSGDRYKIEDYISHQEGCRLYVGEQPRHFKQKRWEKQEKRANDLVGARETVASGAANKDGDGRLLGEWRTESKQTKRAAFSLQQKVWTKLVDGALRAGEEPLLHVQMQDERRVVVRREWFDGQGGGNLSVSTECVNPKSYRLVPGASTPHLVQLEPPGVMLFESEFTRLKGEGP